jgi:hypothetical protein
VATYLRDSVILLKEPLDDDGETDPANTCVWAEFGRGTFPGLFESSYTSSASPGIVRVRRGTFFQTVLDWLPRWMRGAYNHPEISKIDPNFTVPWLFFYCLLLKADLDEKIIGPLSAKPPLAWSKLDRSRQRDKGKHREINSNREGRNSEIETGEPDLRVRQRRHFLRGRIGISRGRASGKINGNIQIELKRKVGLIWKQIISEERAGDCHVEKTTFTTLAPCSLVLMSWCSQRKSWSGFFR